MSDTEDHGGRLGRRQVLELAGASLVVPSVLAGNSATAAAAPTDERVRTDQPEPNRRWERTFDGDPTIVEAVDGVLVLAGGDLHLVDPRSGESRWTAGDVARGDAFVHLAEGTAFVYGSRQAVAVDGSDGTRLWGTRVGDDIVSVDRRGNLLFLGGFGGDWWLLDAERGTTRHSGTVGGTWVFTGGMDDERVYVHPGGGAMTAVDVETGRTVWTRDGAYHWTVLDGDRIYAGTTRETVEALDPATGGRDWQFEGDAYNASALLPLPREAGLFVGSAGHLYRLDPEDGTEQWAYSQQALYVPHPEIVADERVFTTVGGHVIALDLATGAERWTHYTQERRVSIERLGDTLFAGAGGDLLAFDLTGGERWRSVLPGGGEPALAGVDSTLVAGAGGTLVAFGAGTPPDPAISVTTGPPTAGEPVGFSAAGTTDPDTDVDALSFEWTFGDGATATGTAVEHTYDDPGTYEVSVTAADPDGAEGTETRELGVQPAPTPTATPTPSADEEGAAGAPGFGVTAAGLGLGVVAAWVAKRLDG